MICRDYPLYQQALAQAARVPPEALLSYLESGPREIQKRAFLEQYAQRTVPSPFSVEDLSVIEALLRETLMASSENTDMVQPLFRDWLLATLSQHSMMQLIQDWPSTWLFPVLFSEPGLTQLQSLSLSSDDLSAVMQAIESSPPSLISVKAAAWYRLKNWQPGNLADLLQRCSRLSSYQHIQCGRTVLNLLASHATLLASKQAFNDVDKAVLTERMQQYAKNTLEFPVAELQLWQQWLIQEALLAQSVTQIFADWPGQVTLALITAESALKRLQARSDWQEQASTLRHYLADWARTRASEMQASPTELYRDVLPWLGQVLKIPSAEALLLAVQQCRQVPEHLPEYRLECFRYLFNTLLQRNDYAVLRIADDQTFYDALNALQTAADAMSALTSHQGLLFDAAHAVYQVRKQSVRRDAVSALLTSAKQVDKFHSEQAQEFRLEALFWLADKRTGLILSNADKLAARTTLDAVLMLLRHRVEQVQHNSEAAVALDTSAVDAYQQAFALKEKFY